MGVATDAPLRRQALMRLLSLTAIGTGRCPVCQQAAEIFSRHRATPDAVQAWCLACWRANA